MENSVAETKIDSTTLNKAFNAGDSLVIEEHIKTEQLDKQTTPGKEEQSNEDFASLITCGTLIIRKQGQDVKKNSTAAGSKESNDIKNSARQEGSVKRKLEEHEATNGENEERNIRKSYNMLQELFDSKMANVSTDIKAKSKSQSPFKGANRRSRNFDDFEESNEHSKQVKDSVNNISVDSGGSISNLFPDFSVSVLKFQDAIESFSEAMFKDALEESYKENPLMKNEAFQGSKDSDHAGADVHHKFQELKDVKKVKKMDASLPKEEPKHEIIEEPIVEQFVSQLTANQEVIESIIHSINPEEELPVQETFVAETANKVSGHDINESARIKPSDTGISVQCQVEELIEPVCTQQLTTGTSKSKSHENEIERQPVVEESFVEEVKNQRLGSDNKDANISHDSSVENQDDFNITTPNLSPQLEQKLDTFTQQILDDSKAEVVAISKENKSLNQSGESQMLNSMNHSLSIPEICVTTDVSEDVSSPHPEQASEPTWINIPIIRGNSMPEKAGSQISIHEISDSEPLDETSQHSPIISDDSEARRKISEPVSKSGVEIEEIIGTDEESTDKKLPDVHIAFSRHIEDMSHEEAEAFVSVAHEGDVGSVTNAVHDFKKAKISVEETLRYDEQLKDICEYKTDQHEGESKLRQENNSKECIDSTDLNLNNFSKENLDNNELPQETNFTAENMKAMTRSENSAKIQAQCEQIPHDMKAGGQESFQPRSNLQLDEQSNKDTSKLMSVGLTSCSTQTSLHNDVLEPALGWMKAFGMVVVGAILLTYYWIPSGTSLFDP